MDRVYIEGLRAETVIGINPFERGIKQHVLIDLEMAWDCSTAAASGDIADALNYKDVAHRVRDFLAESQDELVETLIERLAKTIMEEFSIPWLRLKLGKPGAVTIAKEVGLIIERGELPK